ncbi:Gfo/Idh/MocA family protein [Stieleria varia]|uniref:Glucose--fructose oxidoreductase n=1 Tax=Stieleria varia TaxID=2528005 RepID=A0A5C6AF47_9BACT|nr:Gfo/Idh/MocA family oxidoreductase [Stieleria varia]TWT98594.1 Glucose--fructose oxidoreductase precursor [Stieleria varia]
MKERSVTRQQEIDTTEAQAPSEQPSTRRGFLKSGSVLSAGLAAGAGMVSTRPVRGAEPEDTEKQVVRIGVVGVGGRGSGAINDSLSINENVKLTALADLSEGKFGIVDRLKKFEGKVDVDPSKMHVGIDGYKRILDDPDVDLVFLTMPPGFRPDYLVEAVDAGKHVFAEKPTCVDPAGYRTCLFADAKAKSNKTAIVTGTQYRRQTNYVEAIKRIHEGQIGDIVGGTTRYCSNGIWFKPRPEGMTDTEYQVFNWMHYIWLSGDQITEQAVHNIDTINWIMGGPPESAYGSGGRFTRPEGSEMWDSISVDYIYPGNRMISFKCRQIPGTKGDNSNVIYGTKGIATIYGANQGATITDRDGNELWSMKGDLSAAYKQEHKDLVDSIRAGEPIVELAATAESSLTATLGRVAAYTGQDVTWDFLTNKSKLNLFPEKLDMKASRPEPKFAVPGETKLI